MNDNYKLLKKTVTKQGNNISLFGSSYIKNSVLIIGVVHGDEPQGEDIINKYLSENKTNLLFIPCLNPDGKALKTRTNSNQVDLNRNFPTKNWELSKKDNYFGGDKPASEIETQFVIDVLNEYNPKIILTLHTPYKVVNYDGPGKNIAEKISDIIKYPISTDIGYPTPGSFGTYAGIERNIPIITLEMDETETINNLYTPLKHIFDMFNENYPNNNPTV